MDRRIVAAAVSCFFLGWLVSSCGSEERAPVATPVMAPPAPSPTPSETWSPYVVESVAPVTESAAEEADFGGTTVAAPAVETRPVPKRTTSKPKPRVTTRPKPKPAPFYQNCAAARAAGAAPLYRGEAGYRSALDRDKDGVACE